MLRNGSKLAAGKTFKLRVWKLLICSTKPVQNQTITSDSSLLIWRSTIYFRYLLTERKVRLWLQEPQQSHSQLPWRWETDTLNLGWVEALHESKNDLTWDSGGQFPYQNCDCWSTPISTRCLKECRSKRFIHPKWLQLLKCKITEKVHRYMNLIRTAGENMHHYRMKIDILKYVNRLSMIKRET